MTTMNQTHYKNIYKMKNLKRIILLIAIFISTIAFSQQVGNTVLRNKGITTAQKNSLTVPVGQFWKVYDTDTGQFEFWNGTAWEGIVAASGLPTEFINGDGTLNNFITVTQSVDLDTMESDTNTNNGKQTNVSTNLSEGTTTNTTVDVNSSDGANATLLAASTSRAGVMTKAKFDEVVVNNSKVSLISGSVNKDKLATELKEKVNLGDVSGVLNIDGLLGVHFIINMTGNITNITFSNLSNEEIKTITLEFTSDGGSYSLFQPNSIKPDELFANFDSTLTTLIQLYLYDVITPIFIGGFQPF